MDGGHKSVGTGLANYASLRAHHNPKTIRESDSYMEPTTSALHRSTERIGRVIDKHLKVFHIETALNNRMFDGPTEFLAKKEEDYTEFDRLKFQGHAVRAVEDAAGGEAEAVHAASRRPTR